MSLDALKAGVMSLVIIGLLAAALVIGLDEFQDQVGDDFCADQAAHTFYNTSEKLCRDTSDTNNDSVTPANYQWNSTDQGLEGTANATGYLDTIGTLLGVGALVAVVIGAFFWATRR